MNNIVLISGVSQQRKRNMWNLNKNDTNKLFTKQKQTQI